MHTNDKTVLIFSPDHKTFTEWVRGRGIKLLRTMYVHIDSDKDFKGRVKEDNYLLHLDGWDTYEPNLPLSKKASEKHGFKTINKEKFETILDGLPDNIYL